MRSQAARSTSAQELAQDPGEVGLVRLAEATEEAVGLGGTSGLDRRTHVLPLIRERNQRRPPVARVWPSFDQAAFLQRIDYLGDRARRDVQAIGELTQTHDAVMHERLERPRMRRRDVPRLERLLGSMPQSARDVPEHLREGLLIIGHRNMLPNFCVVASC